MSVCVRARTFVYIIIVVATLSFMYVHFVSEWVVNRLVHLCPGRIDIVSDCYIYKEGRHVSTREYHNGSKFNYDSLNNNHTAH